MDPAKLTFDALKNVRPGRGIDYMTTFAYWIGVLSDHTSKIACEADEACAAMSHQYDVEEQASEPDALRGYPEYVPAIFQQIAPVTLALRWSPFPAAFAAIGTPAQFNSGRPGNTLAVFFPAATPTFSATTPDELHFQFLLRRACERAMQRNHLVLLAGTPGWSYDIEDDMATNRVLRNLMANFGFVTFRRKPVAS